MTTTTLHPADPRNFDASDRRIPWQRKAESWTAAEITNEEVLKATALLPELQVATPYPTADLPMGFPQVFIAILPDGRRFLVDTQGADYCRYIAAMPVAQAPLARFEKLTADSKIESEMRDRQYRSTLEQMIRSAQDALARPVSTHAGHNLGALAQELSVVAGRFEASEMYGRSLRGGK